MYLLFSVYVEMLRLEWFTGHSVIVFGGCSFAIGCADMVVWRFGRVASKSSNLIYCLVCMFHFAKTIG